ncbi:MAG TPA: hypothetical protein VF633_11465 [Brevundimonas sp.]|jgi:hypothetical protein
MARKASPEIGEGAVIAIPLSDGRWALSQVYRPGISFFLLVFDQVSDRLEDPLVLTGRPILGSWTNDAEIYRGNWKVLTHRPVAPSIFVEPEYTFIIDGETMVESFDGTRRRAKAACGDEALRTRSSQSPLLVQDAARAAFGIEAWKPVYDRMRLQP